MYFPLDCVISAIAVGRDGSRIETGLIGWEGMTGFAIAQGDEETPFELINQAAGDALFMTKEDFKQLLVRAPNVRLLASRFARSMNIQVSYTALANGRHKIQKRLARWLLMMQDRAPHRREFRLTHDYLAIMLGVRRPSVTDAIHILEGERLIRGTRSNLEIVDRNGLIAVAGGIYGTPEDEYARLMALPLNEDAVLLKQSVSKQPASAALASPARRTFGWGDAQRSPRCSDG